VLIDERREGGGGRAQRLGTHYAPAGLELSRVVIRLQFQAHRSRADAMGEGQQSLGDSCLQPRSRALARMTTSGLMEYECRIEDTVIIHAHIDQGGGAAAAGDL
jgi:hypothetical protein